MEELDLLSDSVLLLAIAATRIAAAFAILPVFSPQTIPALVRNSIFVALAIFVFLLQPGLSAAELPLGGWLAIFAKEAMVGVIIGFFFAVLLWAFDIAGRIIDAQVGMVMAQIVDPLTGHQTSLNGAFLARLANFVFMAAGGFTLMLAAILESYVRIPILGGLPNLNPESAASIAAEFGNVMTVSLLIASPALIVLLCLDLALGLVNRFAQQLNVFSLSLSLKAWLSSALILIMLTTIVSALIADMEMRPEALWEFLGGLG